MHNSYQKSKVILVLGWLLNFTIWRNYLLKNCSTIITAGSPEEVPFGFVVFWSVKNWVKAGSALNKRRTKVEILNPPHCSVSQRSSYLSSQSCSEHLSSLALSQYTTKPKRSSCEACEGRSISNCKRNSYIQIEKFNSHHKTKISFEVWFELRRKNCPSVRLNEWFCG